MGVARIDRILRDKRALLLSIDEGLEEGPGAFNMNTIDPAYILNIASEGKYTGIVVNPGLAEKYVTNAFRDVPLIINLNAKTAHGHFNPQGFQLCSVEHAVKLGAQAVGFTLYDGTPADSRLFEQFGKIVEQAHDYGIPVIVWMYQRDVNNHDTDRDAYAARLALELGADAVSIRFSGDVKAFEWIVKCAGKCAVLVADSGHHAPQDVLLHVHDAIRAGATGISFGKTVWQHHKPFSLTRSLQAIVFKDCPVDEALKYLQ